FVPRSSAFARSSALNRVLPARPSASPRRIWLAITPELPRAPMSAPNAAAAATRSADAVGPSASASASAARTVAIMFEPVSPSGTGNTLSALTSSTAASRPAAAARKAPSRPSPSQARRAISAGPSRDVGAAVREVRLAEAGIIGRVRRLAARVELEPGDTDRQPVDLSTDGRPDRVPDRKVDLAGDLGDRQALGDAEMHPDPQRATRDRHAQPARPILDPAQDSVCPVAREARDAVLAERHAADDVDDRPACHERPTADGCVRHRPSLVRPARPSGAVGGAWYSTAPFAPDRLEPPFPDHPEDLLHGPIVRNLRQDVDAGVQPPVGRLEPRARASPLPAEPPAVPHHQGRDDDSCAGLHALPPDCDEVGPLTGHRTR